MGKLVGYCFPGLTVLVSTSAMSFKASRDDICKQTFRMRPLPSSCAAKGWDRIFTSKLIWIKVTVPPLAATSFRTSSHSCRTTSTRRPTPISRITKWPPEASTSFSIWSSHAWYLAHASLSVLRRTSSSSPNIKTQGLSGRPQLHFNMSKVGSAGSLNALGPAQAARPSRPSKISRCALQTETQRGARPSDCCGAKWEEHIQSSQLPWISHKGKPSSFPRPTAHGFTGQGGHFQTHFEGHFQTQTTVNSVLTARDSISGPRKPRVISKHDQGVISNTLTKPWGHFQTQAYFLLPGTAFSGLSISFHVAPTHTFRRGDWGLGWGLGWGKPLTLIQQHCSTHTHLEA